MMIYYCQSECKLLLRDGYSSLDELQQLVNTGKAAATLLGDDAYGLPKTSMFLDEATHACIHFVNSIERR